MEAAELRGRLDDLEDKLGEVRSIVRAMQLSDAESRGDMKAVVGKLDNAATALANAAQSIQKGQLGGEDGKVPKWVVGVLVALVMIVAALVGAKLPSLSSVLP